MRIIVTVSVLVLCMSVLGQRSRKVRDAATPEISATTPVVAVPASGSECAYFYAGSSYCWSQDAFDSIARLKVFPASGNSWLYLESDAPASQHSAVVLLARKGGVENARINVDGNNGVVETRIAGQTVSVDGPGFHQVYGNGLYSGRVVANGFVLRASDNPSVCFQITVTSAGVLGTQSVSCPAGF